MAFTRPAPKRVRPPRKSTSQARREEKTVLLREMDALSLQLCRRRHAERDASATSDTTVDPSMPRPPRFDDATIAAAQQYQQLTQTEMDQHLWIAGLRSLLRSYEMGQQRPPLHVPLVLSKDPAQRRETLRQCHATKISNAHAFVTRQCGSLDLTKPYLSFDKFEDPATASHTITSLAITPYPGVDSVRKVFDAMKYWMSNVELCITDELGTVTIREDDEDDGTTDTENNYSSLRRVRSTLDCGLSIEGNYAVFRQFFPPPPGTTDEPYAVLTIQAVDEDPLFPYHPEEHIRVEITGGMVISKTISDQQESGVTLARWVSLKLVGNGGNRVPTAEQAEAIGQDAARWLVVLQRVIRDRVYAQT